VPACEQNINGSPDKHKGVVQATRALCSRETRCSAARWGDTSTRTRASTLACSLSRARACGWIGRAEGSTPRVYVFAFVRTSAAWPRGRHKTDGTCTATTQRQELNEQI
jgi:hypothetical protein